MNGLTAMTGLNNIDDRYIEAAYLPADAEKAKPEKSRRSSFLNSGWAAAAICAVVGIGVYTAILGLGKGWFGFTPGAAAGPVTSGTNPAETQAAETETAADTELVVNCPAEGVYIARTDKLSLKREVMRPGAMPILNMINGLAFEPGQPDIRPDLVLMVDGTYYLCRSSTGQINDPAGGRTAVLSEEDRAAFTQFFENGKIKTGFADELIQLPEEDMLKGLKQYITENGTPCTVYRKRNSLSRQTLITNEPHCLEYKGPVTIVMTVDRTTDCLIVYFSDIATLTIRSNGDLYYRMDYPGELRFDHITGRGQPYDHKVTNAGYYSSSQRLPWEWELYHYELLDTAFRRGWGMNVSLKSLGYMIDEYTH